MKTYRSTVIVLILRLLGGQLAMVLAAGLVLGAFALAGLAPAIYDDYRVRVAANILLAAAVVIAVAFYANKWGGVRRDEFRLGFNGRDLLFTAIVAVLVLGIPCLYVMMLGNLGVREVAAASPALPMLLLGFLGEFGVIHEEVLARGFFLRLLSKRTGIVTALLISAALFSVSHLIFKKPDYLLVDHFIMGIVLGYAYLKSGTLVVPILMHALHNFSADLFLQGNDDGVSIGLAVWHFSERLGAGQRLPLTLVLGLLELVLIWLVYSRRRSLLQVSPRLAVRRPEPVLQPQ